MGHLHPISKPLNVVFFYERPAQPWVISKTKWQMSDKCPGRMGTLGIDWAIISRFVPVFSVITRCDVHAILLLQFIRRYAIWENAIIEEPTKKHCRLYGSRRFEFLDPVKLHVFLQSRHFEIHCSNPNWLDPSAISPWFWNKYDGRVIFASFSASPFSEKVKLLG